MKLSKKQKFRYEINKSIQDNLTNNNDQQCLDQNNIVNTIFIGKNKVMIKSIVDNDNVWKKKRNKLRHKKNTRKISTFTKFNHSIHNNSNMKFNTSIYNRKYSENRYKSKSLFSLPKKKHSSIRNQSNIYKEDLNDSYTMNKISPNNIFNLMDEYKSSIPNLPKLTIDTNLSLNNNICEKSKSLSSKLKKKNSFKIINYFKSDNIKIPENRIINKNKISFDVLNNLSEGPANHSQSILFNSSEDKKDIFLKLKNKFDIEEEFKQTPKTQNPFLNSIEIDKTKEPVTLKSIFNASDDINTKSDFHSIEKMKTIQENTEQKSQKKLIINKLKNINKIDRFISKKRKNKKSELTGDERLTLINTEIQKMLNARELDSNFTEADGE